MSKLFLNLIWWIFPCFAFSFWLTSFVFNRSRDSKLYHSLNDLPELRYRIIEVTSPFPFYKNNNFEAYNPRLTKIKTDRSLHTFISSNEGTGFSIFFSSYPIKAKSYFSCSARYSVNKFWKYTYLKSVGKSKNVQV